jgi:hypothetical protein
MLHRQQWGSMSTHHSYLWRAAAAVLVVLCTSVVAGGQTVNRDAQTFSEFQQRVKDYVTLQQKLAATLPSVPDKATPVQIDERQRALGKLVITARKTAKQGEVFGPAMPALVRRLLAPVFKGPDGAEVRQAIFDEPHPVVPAVNVRYPDEVPLSTMPPDILKLLPKLPENLEFRFIGRHLILLDVNAHLIVDVIDNAIPA